MKANVSMAALLFALCLPAAQAQTELAIANHTGNCPSCSAKEQKILKLQAELATLRGDFAQPAPTTEIPPIELIEEAPRAAVIETSDATYTVKSGDGLMKIARMKGCSTASLAAANGLTLDSLIHPGQVLKLPATAKAVPSQPAVEAAPKPVATTYTIQDGDTYYSLSRRFKIPLDDLMAANPKAKATHLYTGRVINLPGATTDELSTPVAPPETTIDASVADTTPETAATEEAPATSEKKIIAITVNQEISYGDFASKHGTDIERLNSLNDLSLTSATILAKGSELYVPAMPQL